MEDANATNIVDTSLPEHATKILSAFGDTPEDTFQGRLVLSGTWASVEHATTEQLEPKVDQSLLAFRTELSYFCFKVYSLLLYTFSWAVLYSKGSSMSETYRLSLGGISDLVRLGL